jgi:hypothetical protein
LVKRLEFTEKHLANLGNRRKWVNFGLLATQVRSQLFALIFMKSMNSKEVKTPDKSRHKNTLGIKKKVLDADTGVEVEIAGTEFEPLLAEGDRTSTEHKIEVIDETADDIEDSNTLPLAKTAVNLLGVDVGRVTEFCGWSPDLIGCSLTIIIAIWFLVGLIGWPR